MQAIFGSVVAVLSVYRYPLVFLGAIVEGPLLMMASGILLRLGQFSFWPLYLSLIFGDFTADIFWYWVGRYAAEPFLRRFGYIFGVNRANFEKMEDVFRRHDTKILFISKITMGFGFALATLMAAGAMRVPFKKYLFLNLLGGFVWTGLLVSVGYFFGNLYAFVDKGFHLAFIFATIVILTAVFYGVASFVRRKYID